MSCYATTRVTLGNLAIGSVVRLGGRLHRVVTPRILEDCISGEWVYDAELYGYEDVRPVNVEFIGRGDDPHVRELIKEEKQR